MMNFNEWLLLRYYYEVGKQPDGTTDASAYSPTLVQLVRDKVEVIRANEALQEKYKRLKKAVQKVQDLESVPTDLAEAHSRVMQRITANKELKNECM